LTSHPPDEITQRLLERHLERHASGIQVLAAVHHTAQELGELDQEQLITILDQLETMSDIVILDAGSGITPTALEAIRRSHFTVLVIEPDAVALSMARSTIQRLEQVGLAGNRLGLTMVSRSRSASTFTREEVEQQLHSELLAVFTPAPEICFHATKTGKPILLSQPDTITAAQFHELGKALS